MKSTSRPCDPPIDERPGNACDNAEKETQPQKKPFPLRHPLLFGLASGFIVGIPLSILLRYLLDAR